MSEPKDEILAELRRITRLLVLVAIEGKAQKDQVFCLSRVGFQPREIAELLGTTANTVRVTLSTARKRSAKTMSVKGDDSHGLP